MADSSEKILTENRGGAAEINGPAGIWLNKLVVSFLGGGRRLVGQLGLV